MLPVRGINLPWLEGSSPEIGFRTCPSVLLVAATWLGVPRVPDDDRASPDTHPTPGLPPKHAADGGYVQKPSAGVGIL